MPNDNVEIVKHGFKAFNENGIDGILPFLDREFEATTPPSLASEPDTDRGDRVIVEFTLRARGKTTGLDFGQDAAMLWVLRDGRAVRLDLFETVDEARAAATGGAAR